MRWLKGQLQFELGTLLSLQEKKQNKLRISVHESISRRI